MPAIFPSYHPELISSVSFFPPKIRKPLTIYYRNYKNFSKKLFVTDFENLNLAVNSDDPHENHVNLSETFSKVVQRHAPIKKEDSQRKPCPFYKQRT